MSLTLAEQNRRLRSQVATLNARLKLAEQLHKEWVATMLKMHGAALESLERIRADEINRRAHAEAAFEPVNGERFGR